MGKLTRYDITNEKIKSRSQSMGLDFDTGI